MQTWSSALLPADLAAFFFFVLQTEAAKSRAPPFALAYTCFTIPIFILFFFPIFSNCFMRFNVLWKEQVKQQLDVPKPQ